MHKGHASGPTFVYWGNTLALSGGHPWHVQNGADAEWMVCVARQQGCFFARKFRPLRTVQQALVQALSEGGGTPKNCDDIVHPAVLSGHSSYGLPVLPPRRPASNSTGVYRADEVLALVASALAAAQTPFVLGRSTTLGVRKGQLHAKALDFAVFYADLPRGPLGCGDAALVQHAMEERQFELTRALKQTRAYYLTTRGYSTPQSSPGSRICEARTGPRAYPLLLHYRHTPSGIPCAIEILYSRDGAVFAYDERGGTLQRMADVKPRQITIRHKKYAAWPQEWEAGGKAEPVAKGGCLVPPTKHPCTGCDIASFLHSLSPRVARTSPLFTFPVDDAARKTLMKSNLFLELKKGWGGHHETRFMFADRRRARGEDLDQWIVVDLGKVGLHWQRE